MRDKERQSSPEEEEEEMIEREMREHKWEKIVFIN
jgi:outer membrane lipopolysaccharide assembly protein LptE/RlpB